MITDKDREELIEDLRAYNDAWVLEEGKDRDRLIEFESAIRAESAEQARKEAAERVRKEFGAQEGGSNTIDRVCSAILGDSATVSTDSEKLAIAVKSLEEIKQIRKAGPAFESHFSKLQDIGRITNDAIKEMQV